MNQKSLKDLEADLANLSKQLISLSQQIENINANIAKVLQSLQTQFSKQKKQELAELEVQELALEDQYLETHKKHFDLRRHIRASVISLLKEDPKVCFQMN
jgi:TolA-binding protein